MNIGAGFALRLICLTGLTISSYGCDVRYEEPLGQRLEASFEADRIFVRVPVAGSSDTLRLYTDTGGGLFLFGAATDRLGLSDSSGVRLSRLAGPETFPDPLGAKDQLVPIYRPDAAPEANYDGMLGQAWFADRVWTLNYPNEELILRAAPDSVGTRMSLSFMSDSTGARVLSFPRVQIVVDDETIDLLFDTGATVDLSDSALAHFGGTSGRERATSFITTGVLERWHERNPEWRMIEDGDRTIPGMRMIEVPEIDIGGERVGPVWFTERADTNFHDFMSQWMDQRVEGALGGNALRSFSVTLDYPGSAAWLRLVAAS